ncbi:hypothetical protein E5163_13240 [Marinicauda algicola]|uniref:BLUF domain-containing protein n=1 Tax=Marinicauda algicola TaxID=2029849 RepID=A0A4S2GXL7_9PROT|nr:BLUF domain-containing protein [Marinicauda algicola]TGY87875.1 hypothetical protein E5163_13240 [Marinicauda algicola]
MTVPLKCVLYVSRSLIPAEREEFREQISEIMAQCDRNNRADDITGALAYDRGRFFQYVEGPADAIDALVARLFDDPRHKRVTIRADEPVATRLFPDWSMVLLNITAAPVPGYATADLEALSPGDLVARLQRAAAEDAILAVARRPGARD